MLKTCRVCKTEKPLTEFNKGSVKGGHVNICKSCHSEYMKEYVKANKEKLSEKGRDYYEANKEKRLEYQKAWQEANKTRVRDAQLKRKYGISLEQYEAMLSDQCGGCAICGCSERSNKYKPLCVDHSHETGEIRGLLCNSCNRAIGLLQDDPNVLRQAAEYIEKTLAVTKQEN